MKKVFFLIVCCIAAVISCTDSFDPGKEGSSTEYLIVEALITDYFGPQSIVLSKSIPYSGNDVDSPVCGALVTVSDGTSPVKFKEDSETPGTYLSPAYFRAETGKEYTLTIKSGGKEYTSTATMGRFGFEIEKIDYKYTPNLAENTWTIGAWGQNTSGNYYLITTSINGNVFPLQYATLLNDKYFGEAHLDGFPITVLSQSEEKRQELGDCGKPLESGDMITLICCNLSKDAFDFMSALANNTSQVSIPILSPRPANLPCNIKGENVMGYFAACPANVAFCIVDDPFRTEFLVDKE